MNKKHIREGFSVVTPYLIVNQVESLFEFMKHVFGAVETYRSLQPDGKVKHAEFRIGDSMIMAAEAPEPEMAMPCNLYLYVENPDYFYLRSLQAGGISMMEPTNRPIGERLAGVKDPTGNLWWMASPI